MTDHSSPTTPPAKRSRFGQFLVRFGDIPALMLLVGVFGTGKYDSTLEFLANFILGGAVGGMLAWLAVNLAFAGAIAGWTALTSLTADWHNAFRAYYDNPLRPLMVIAVAIAYLIGAKASC